MIVGLYMVVGALFPVGTGLLAIYDAVVTAAPEGTTMSVFGLGSTGILGAVMVGWGDLFRRLAGLGSEPTWAGVRHAVRWSVVLWFVVDCAFSVAIGAPWNLVGNVGFLALLAGPTFAGGPASARPTTQQRTAG